MICIGCKHFGVNGCLNVIWCYAKKKKASTTIQKCKLFEPEIITKTKEIGA